MYKRGVFLFTKNMKNEKDLAPMRHTLAHIMMQALRRLYKDPSPGVGPAIDDGFYHDFDSSRKISEEDFDKIEAEMKKIIAEDLRVEKSVLPIDEGIKKLEELGYKNTVELAKELKEQGETEISFYTQGEFTNMCKGPHVESTGKVGAFKLTKVAGAYWRGDEKNHMMQRIYGIAFENAKELRKYEKMMEEAKKRDHRKLGVEFDLFTFSDLVGPGLPLWTPRGTLLRNLLDDYVWEMRKERGYSRVTIPHITKKDLYETSGHWSKFKDELFRVKTREGHEFALKPMNCPHHTQIYNHVPRSYRDLPQRYADTTMVYRDEQSGELSGLSRVRSITQDDAHVFCRQSQVEEEFLKVWDIITIFYKTFGFEDLRVRLSFHDPENPDAYLGTPEVWEKAENALRDMAKSKGVEYFEAAGEAAFYGPKVDFVTKDSIGRELQVATIQLDMNMPERFDLHCINEKGEKERIVMIHAAIMGSLERFMVVLIEHFAASFPTWISPEQVALVPVSEAHFDYARELGDVMNKKGIRVQVYESADPVGKRIRDAANMKVPYILVLGDNEMNGGEFSVRVRGSKDQVSMKQDEFLQKVVDEIENRTLAP